jgi:hypothetical protein
MDVVQEFAGEIGPSLVEKTTFSSNATKFLDSLSRYFTTSELAPLKGVNTVMTRNLKRGIGGHATLQGDRVTVVFNERLMGKVPNIWFAALVVHELEHVRQFREGGAFGYGDKEAELAAYGREISFLNRVRPKLSWLEKRQADERIAFAKSVMARVRAGKRVMDSKLEGNVDPMFLKADDEDVIEDEITEVNVQPPLKRPPQRVKDIVTEIVEEDIAARGPAPRKKIKARRKAHHDKQPKQPKE